MPFRSASFGSTIQGDAPSAGFFLLGMGAGVCLTLASHPVAVGFAVVALGAGGLILTSRYLGWPIRALRPPPEPPPIQPPVQIAELNIENVNVTMDQNEIVKGIVAALSGESGAKLDWPLSVPRPDPNQPPLFDQDEDDT
jgi:hypothetical protein